MYTVYSGSNCQWCVRAKNLLESKNVDFTEISLDNPATLSEFKETFPNVRRVPLILDDNENVIGGYNDLRKHLEG